MCLPTVFSGHVPSSYPHWSFYCVTNHNLVITGVQHELWISIALQPTGPKNMNFKEKSSPNFVAVIALYVIGKLPSSLDNGFFFWKIEMVVALKKKKEIRPTCGKLSAPQPHLSSAPQVHRSTGPQAHWPSGPQPHRPTGPLALSLIHYQTLQVTHSTL